MNKKTPARLYGEQLCKDFPPPVSSNSLGRKLYEKYPESFSSLKAAQDRIRTIRGVNGVRHREKTSDKSNFKTPEPNNNRNQYSLPPSKYELPDSYANDYTPFILDQSRTLIISDLHIPYHDNKAIELALDYGLEKKVNCILINGDLLDMPNHSRFEKDWRARTTTQEFEAARQFLRALRHTFPKARIVFKEGNHDDRWERWLFNKAIEIFDDPEYKLDAKLKLGELRIEHVKDKRPIKIGKLWILHGHEMAGGAGGVNPSRSTFLKTITSSLVGHYHKSSQHTEAAMNGEIISVHSTGCLCGLNPLYMPINKHNLGFAYVECDLKTGEYNLENLKIIKGKVYQ